MNLGLVVLKDKQTELGAKIKRTRQEIEGSEYTLKCLMNYKDQIDKSIEALERVKIMKGE